MSNNSKKYISLTRLSDFLDNIKEKFSQIGHKHKIADITDYTPISVDTELSSTSTNPVQNKVLDAEFDAIGDAMGALELAIDGKTDIGHNHDDLYYTEEEIDEKINEVKEDASNKDVVILLEAQKSIDGVQTVIDSHISNENIHITSAERTNWNTAYANSTSVDTKISAHNTSTSAHNDIRVLINDLTTRLNTLANSDDTTLDQMSEIVAYIKNNKSLIDGVTTSKVNVADIVDNLTTNVPNKVLSAAQGVVIKGLIDALQEYVDSHTHTISDVSNLQSVLDGKVSTEELNSAINEAKEDASNKDVVVLLEAQKCIDALQTNLDSHTERTDIHITNDERTSWNGKADKTYVDEELENAVAEAKEDASNKDAVVLIEAQKGIDAVKTQLDNKANKSQGVYYIEGSGSSGDIWRGTHEDITEYYAGLMIAYKNDAVGASSYDETYLNINNLGSVEIVRNASEIYTGNMNAIGSIIFLVYTIDSNGKAYWKVCEVDTKNTTGTSNKSGSKMYLVGASYQSSYSDTYSNNKVYIGTDNCLYSNGAKVITSEATTSAAGLMSASDKTKLDGVQTQLDNKANKSQGVYYIEGTKGTYNEDWVGTHEDITEYYAGLTIAYKTPTSGGTIGDYTWLNINNLGYKYIVVNNDTKIETDYPTGSVLLLVYTIDSSGTAYWKIADNDTKNTAGSTNKVGSKMYLIGSTYQSSSGTTYSNKNVYIGTDNCLYSNGEKVVTTGTAYSKTLLWTNASPTSNFSAQALAFNLTNYNAVEVIYTPTLADYNPMSSGEIPVIAGKISYFRLYDNYSTSVDTEPTSRSLVSVDTTQITFNPLDRNCSVPYKIYGIKYGN